MEFIMDLISACRQGLAGVAAQPASLPGALFLAGLAGSLVHCVGMCGPFVLGQVMADAEKGTAGSYGEWQRLAGAALVPYHFGRLTTYTALGAAAGAATALFTATPTFAWLSSVLLLIAAALMLLQAFGLAVGTMSPLTAGLTRLAGPLSSSQGPAARYALGVVLGFLPCGLLYGALAAAAGTASASEGALAMAAFALGTVPALIAVGWGGLIARRRLHDVARWIAAPLLLANAALMLALAIGRL
ncbi:MAG: sulfite exporter TauE/SafE family protein [Rhodospirillales bacterium]|nr:sulfite exporter TauE/SafE family protein [Rhodospirillales bacterium]